MGEIEAREGFRVRLEAVERALTRLADNPLHHRALIQDLEKLRQRCLAALGRRVEEVPPVPHECQLKAILPRMPEREERFAVNETLFRDLNERIQKVVTTIALEVPNTLEIFCECGSSDCVAKITLSLAEYEGVRAHPARFFIAPGHEITDVEDVVERRTGYWVVEKHEEAAQIARERDPRS